MQKLYEKLKKYNLEKAREKEETDRQFIALKTSGKAKKSKKKNFYHSF